MEISKSPLLGARCQGCGKTLRPSNFNMKIVILYTVINIIPVNKRLGESAVDLSLCRECNSNYWNKHYNSRNWVGSQKPYQLLEVLSK